MKVKQIIEKLKKFDPEAEVYYYYGDDDYNCYYKIKYLELKSKQVSYNKIDLIVALEA